MNPHSLNLSNSSTLCAFVQYPSQNSIGQAPEMSPNVLSIYFSGKSSNDFTSTSDNKVKQHVLSNWDKLSIAFVAAALYSDVLTSSSSAVSVGIKEERRLCFSFWESVTKIKLCCCCTGNIWNISVSPLAYFNVRLTLKKKQIKQKRTKDVVER